MPQSNFNTAGALALSLELGIEAFRYSLLGTGYSQLAQLAFVAGSAAATEGHPIGNSFVDRYGNLDDGWRSQCLRWYFQKGYWSTSKELATEDFYSLSYENGRVRIISRCVDGATGDIVLNQAMITPLFNLLANSDPSSFMQWGMDPFPVGGHPVFLFIDDANHPQSGQLMINPDTHPCRGSISFGDRDRECRQIGAFLQLESQVRNLFVTRQPSISARQMAKDRLQVIADRVGIHFLPDDGYCTSCDGDVTYVLADVPAGASITGCPLCHATWCD